MSSFQASNVDVLPPKNIRHKSVGTIRWSTNIPDRFKNKGCGSATTLHYVDPDPGFSKNVGSRSVSNAKNCAF
jgi:hypothetical protein